MNVWKMNLLDRRKKASTDNCAKYNFCREKGIVGIGWVGIEEAGLEPENKDFVAFSKAKSNFDKIEIGDLVWVNVPDSQDFYLCQITSNVQKADSQEYFTNDISYYRQCEYIHLLTKQNAPRNLICENLSSHSTISASSSSITLGTNELFNDIKMRIQREKENTEESIVFKKKHWIILSSIIVAIVLLFTISSIISNSKNNSYNETLTVAVQEYLSGKTFVYRESDTKVYAYTFNDNTLGTELWDSALHTKYGNLNDAKQYKATGSPKSDEIHLLYNDNGKWQLVSTAVLHEDGTVEFPSNEWTLTAIDEIDKLRLQTLCDHVFALETIIKNATHFGKGQSKRTCSRCWKNEIYEFNFVEQHRPSLWDIKSNVKARTLLTDRDIVAKDGSKEVYEGFQLTLVVNDDQLILKNNTTTFTTISNSRGNIEKVYLISSGSFNEYAWRDIMYYTFNGSDPLDLDSGSTFITLAQCTSKDNTTYYTYDYGGITYELKKYYPSGHCFTIYFEDTI